MCKTLAFENLSVTDQVRIDVDFITGGVSDRLWFELSEPIVLTNDNIATALSTLAGRTFDSVHFGFPVSEATLAGARRMTNARVEAQSIVASACSAPRAGNLLSFSGGFDSLAALNLMPVSTKLVSMDFGGRFAREKLFFDKFPTVQVRTNLLETGLHRNSWSFMGIGAILLGDHYRSAFHTFGSILEAGADNLNVNPAAAKGETFPPFRTAGFQNAPYVAGLTEVGTIMVLARFQGDLVGESLRSLAGPGEEKLYRKQVLTQVVADRRGVDLPITLSAKPPVPHFSFGQNFAVDLLSLYVAKFASEETARELVGNMPDEAIALARRHDLTFFERANSTLYEKFPSDLFGGLVSRMSAAGITFYSESDWMDYRAVREFLGTYHSPISS